MTLGGDGTSKFARGWLAVLAVAVVVALTFASLIGAGTGAALAATSGLTTNVTINGDQYDGTSVVNEGDTVTMKIQYSNTVAPGSTVKIVLGPNVTLKNLPKGNTAVSAIKVDPADPNAVLITFANPFPADVNQGVLDLTFTVNSVEKSSEEKISWQVDGAEQSVTVIVKNNGDEFANVSNAVSKSVASTNLNQFVSVKDGVLTLGAGILGAEIPYTLQLDTSVAQNGYVISDKLPAGIKYVAGSFTGTQTTWDAAGLNKASKALTFGPTVTGNSFSDQLDLPGPSKTTLKYKAVVADEAARVELQGLLQAEYEKVAVNGGNFSLKLENVASLGGTTKKASTSIGGSVAGPVKPGVGKAFKKTSTWTNGTALEPGTDGALDPAKDVAFKFMSDLREWSGVNSFTTLNSNVVISDDLPSQLSWKSTSADFIKSAELSSLKKAASWPGDITAFQADSYVGSYYVDEATQTLYINIGRDNTRVVNITVLAQLNTITGLPVKDSPTVPGQKDYSFTNRGVWNYTDTTKQNQGSNNPNVVTNQTENEDGFNDPDYFKKTGPSKTLEVDPGSEVPVPYTFSVGAVAGIDLTKSSIVDYVDTTIFNVSDLAGIKAGISAKYDGRAMLPGDFDVALNADKNLVVSLNAAGKAKVTGWGTKKAFSLTLTLTTKPVDGKQTLQIKNKATLFGEDNKALFWSESASEATTFGDEAEVRKTVRNTPQQEWTQNLRARVDADGNLVQTQFVYNIGLIPWGNYDSVPILDVVDVLPAGLKFVGFVADTNVDTGANPVTGTQNLKGNVQARFDAATATAPSGTVTLFQKPGTILNASDGIPSVNILVTIEDFEIGEAIVNTIGSTTATIVPSDGYPLSIKKVDSENASKVISDTNARFQILDAAGVVVLDNVFVKDGLLNATGRDGAATIVKVQETGSYTVKEITAPAGYVLSTQTVEAVVAADGSSNAVTFVNAPVHNFAVGDFVWVDANKDGLQGDAEVLAGVKVTLLNGEGGVVETTTTNAQGWYIFDELPAGDYQLKFELTEQQQVQYVFTVPNAQNNAADATDSDVDPATGLTSTFTLDATNKALTKDYDLGAGFKATDGIDPTWDAGVMLKPSVSVGDYVWVDTNRDGIQGEPGVEPGIKDVVLVITGPDGKDVTDVFGKPVGPVSTEKDGKYTFANLPVLAEGQSYTVSIDQEKSKDSLAPYIPTLDTGADRATNSSTWSASSEGLTKDGDRDPTLDFGFVLPKVSVGDYVWVDTNRDGIQSEGEKGIADVVLSITGPGGKAVTDVFGQPVGPVTTDADGKYRFANLPVLTAGQTYTVTIDQVASAEPLAPYISTITGAGNTGTDSSTDSISTDKESALLGKDGDHDPSLDFGFVLPRVSVGDFVWVDSNGNGRQDEGEKGIKDVVLSITGPDGQPVTDVFGKPVEPVATDSDGKYTFVNLPVLKEGEFYTVSIDKKKSANALAPYLPTKAGMGERAGDSSNWTVNSQGLLADGDHDPSLDFGFVVIPEPAATTPAASTPPASGDLSNTGFDGAVLLAMGLMLSVLGGAAVALTVRRRRTVTQQH